jgi:hypothetical protein
MKVKRRQLKEERRAARKSARDNPFPAAGDEQAEEMPVDTEEQADDGGEPRD